MEVVAWRGKDGSSAGPGPHSTPLPFIPLPRLLLPGHSRPERQVNHIALCLASELVDARMAAKGGQQW